jgi:hypothetical protein
LDKVKINLYGESLRLKKIQLNEELANKLIDAISALKISIGQALLDLEFYEYLNHPYLRGVEDLQFDEVGGLLNCHKSLVEIWFNGKKAKKLNLDTLFRPNTLFTLYNTSILDIKKENLEPGIYLLENEIGLIACYELAIENFVIDKLRFNLITFQSELKKTEVLSELFYKDELLICKRSDVLLNESEGFVMN